MASDTNLRKMNMKQLSQFRDIQQSATIAMVAVALLVALLVGVAQAGERPNIVVILADDMGVGDVSALNPDAKVKTPNLDALAGAGVSFSDAHTSAAVCTPTRYSLLTGRYSWRSQLKERVLSGYSPCLIPKQRETVASMLKKQGYTTALIGKWHLGISWTKKDGSVFTELNPDGSTEEQIDFGAPIQLGPTDLGFDYFFGTAASWDMPPYAFIENDRLHDVPLVKHSGRIAPEPDEVAEARKSGASNDEIKEIAAKYPKASWRPGIAAVDMKPTNAMPRITQRTVKYIRDYEDDSPFFLYMPLTAPHTPVTPNKQFVGTSQAGTYGDFVHEVDDAVGQVVEALKESGEYNNTLLIFTADNGYSLKAFPDSRKEHFGHNPSFVYNGAKGRLLEGGHRVPFLVTWPGVVKVGTRCDSLICLSDLFATCAELTGARISDNTAEDSVSLLRLLKGSTEGERDTLVVRDFVGRLAIRKGDWKLSSGQRPQQFKLFNLADDIGEQTNLIKTDLAKVNELTEIIAKFVRDGRSTPGPPQKNDGPPFWEQIDWINKAETARAEDQ